MFNNIQVKFGLCVGFILMVLGELLLFISPAGWSLLAVGVAVAAVTILLNLPEKNHQAVMQPLLCDDIHKHSIGRHSKSL